MTKGGETVEQYSYDPNGTRNYEYNALRGTTGRNYTYSEEDHLLTAGDVEYQYDKDGFLTTKTRHLDPTDPDDPTEITSYSYSSRGELLSVTLPDKTLIEYVHDPLGRRSAKKVDGTITEKYLWQVMTRLLAVYDGSDNLLMRFEYADERMPMAVTTEGVTYYLVYDQVGSLRVVADSSGAVIKEIGYDSFGNIIDETNEALKIPLGFAGGLHDRDTGLVRFGFRDYDPDVGRWTAKDPIFFAGGDTDLYGYVLNDPINLVDPDGLHGIMVLGRGPYIFRPSVLRGGPRYGGKLRPFKETPVRPRYIPRPKGPVKIPKTRWGRFLDKLADWLGWGGAGAAGISGVSIGNTSSDPCGSSSSQQDPGFYHPIYNPGGYI